MDVDGRDQCFRDGMRQAGTAILMARSAHEVSERESAVRDALSLVYAERLQEMARKAAGFYLEHQDAPDGVSRTVGLVTEGWVVALSESLALSEGLLGMVHNLTGRPLEELIDAAIRTGDR